MCQSCILYSRRNLIVLKSEIELKLFFRLLSVRAHGPVSTRIRHQSATKRQQTTIYRENLEPLAQPTLNTSTPQAHQ